MTGKLAEDMGMMQQNFSAALIERLRAYCIRGYQHIINGVTTQTKQASFISLYNPLCYTKT